MNPAHKLPKPLAIVHAQAMGAAGLDATAVGAAMWSQVARFELVDGALWQIEDVLRLAMCPLFDRATPHAERLQGMVLGCEPHAHERPGQRPTLHLLGQKDAGAIIETALQRPLTSHHQGHAGAVAIIEAIGRRADSVAGAPGGTLIAVDSLIDGPLLRAAHKQGLLSTEDRAEGLVAAEGAACLGLMGLNDALVQPTCVLGVVRGACSVPLHGQNAARALEHAMQQAMGADAKPMHTVLWDVGGAQNHIASVAEALLAHGTLTAQAKLVRPMQTMGHMGQSFIAHAIAQALYGSRAGLTQGGRSLICAIDEHAATAVYVESFWRPNIMLADAERAAP